MSELPFDAAEPDDPLVGALLQDRYRVIRKLGAGGMGVVYEGEHVRIRKRVAIKCLHAQFAKNRDVLARFHREALAATAIGNEHIVEVTDLDHLADGTVFLVLEYLDGRDLGHDLDERGHLPVARAVHILSQMCEALAIAHDKGIIHRDITARQRLPRHPRGLRLCGHAPEERHRGAYLPRRASGRRP